MNQIVTSELEIGDEGKSIADYYAMQSSIGRSVRSIVGAIMSETKVVLCKSWSWACLWSGMMLFIHRSWARSTLDYLLGLIHFEISKLVNLLNCF